MLLTALLAAPLTLGTTPSLSTPDWSIPPGDTLDFHVQGEAGAFWTIYASPAPAELDLGALGVLRISLLGAFPIGSGFTDGAGSAALALAVPGDPLLVDQIVYAQAATAGPSGILLSNGAAVRIDAAPLLGPRTPVGVSAAASGGTLLVVHEEESALSIVDAATGAFQDVPVAPISAAEMPFGQMSVALAPDGAHAFVATATDGFLTVVHVPSGSVSAKLPVPRGTRRVAFATVAGSARAYATNDRDEALLEFTEIAGLGWIPTATHALAGRWPGPIAADAAGRLWIGQRVTRAIEVFDPASGTTAALIPIGGVPKDVAISG